MSSSGTILATWCSASFASSQSMNRCPATGPVVGITDSPENKLSKSWSPSGDKSRRWVMGRAREALQPRVRDQEGGIGTVPERLNVGEGGLVALGAALPFSSGGRAKYSTAAALSASRFSSTAPEALDPSVGVDYLATKLFNSVLLSSMNHMSPGMQKVTGRSSCRYGRRRLRPVVHSSPCSAALFRRGQHVRRGDPPWSSSSFWGTGGPRSAPPGPSLDPAPGPHSDGHRRIGDFPDVRRRLQADHRL